MSAQRQMEADATNIWLQLIHWYATECDLPVEQDIQKPLESLSALALESELRRALKLRKNWASVTPRPTRHVCFKTPGPESPGWVEEVVTLSLLPGRGGRWLLSASDIQNDTGDVVAAVVRCWDTQAHRPVCAVSMELEHGLNNGALVNLEPNADAIFALHVRSGGVSRDINIFTIDFETAAFVKLYTIAGQGERVFLLQGSMLVVQHRDGDKSLLDIRNPTAPHIKLRHRTIERPHVVLLRPTYAIVAYTKSIEIYPVPHIPTEATTNIVVESLTHHKWAWPLDQICIAEQGYLHLDHDVKARPRPIDLLIRFGINIVHHFVLPVNLHYQPSWPVTAINLPYLPPPQLMQSLSSPIRLFSQADIALGPYGTALFIDSNQDESQSDLAQRLAGQMLTRLGKHSDDNDSAIQGAASAQELVPDEPVSGFPSMVFLIREHDNWTRLAMDEQAGKVAFARMNADLELLEYV
ncbi:hypothetical protein HWV62_389 [Athelia sp. TMB]|nr:hypothetical protein HWV62_389 [Athelia sp. TMB]